MNDFSIEAGRIAGAGRPRVSGGAGVRITIADVREARHRRADRARRLALFER